jgi:transcription elongation factor GreA
MGYQTATRLKNRVSFFKLPDKKENQNEQNLFDTKKIGEAREFGDLSENAEYDFAKNEQALIEHEITEMEAKLRDCVVINKNNIDTSKVSVGCFVTCYDVDFDEEVKYQIIGSTESNPSKGLISNESPVGKALLGHGVGETVDVHTPVGVCQLKILKIEA